ncbi:hypothetical protein ACRAWF_16370 [Streptomyces sp. L7]
MADSDEEGRGLPLRPPAPKAARAQLETTKTSLKASLDSVGTKTDDAEARAQGRPSDVHDSVEKHSRRPPRGDAPNTRPNGTSRRPNAAPTTRSRTPPTRRSPGALRTWTRPSTRSWTPRARPRRRRRPRRPSREPPGDTRLGVITTAEPIWSSRRDVT